MFDQFWQEYKKVVFSLWVVIFLIDVFVLDFSSDWITLPMIIILFLGLERESVKERDIFLTGAGLMAASALFYLFSATFFVEKLALWAFYFFVLAVFRSIKKQTN